MTGRAYTRSGYFIAPRPSTRSILLELSNLLISDGEMSKAERRRAANYLYRLANSEKALATLEAKPVGRAPSPDSPDIALDYLLHRRAGNIAKAARPMVARRWSVSAATVKAAFTAHRGYADWMYRDLISNRVGNKRAGYRQSDGAVAWQYWTKDLLLEAAIADLLKIRETDRRSPSIKSRK